VWEDGDVGFSEEVCEEEGGLRRMVRKGKGKGGLWVGVCWECGECGECGFVGVVARVEVGVGVRYDIWSTLVLKICELMAR